MINAKNPLVLTGKILGGLVLLWLVGSFYLFSQSSSSIFSNQTSWASVPNFGYEQIYRKDSKNQFFSIWEIKNPNTDNYVIYTHGNAGRLLNFFPELSKKFNVISPAYAGYSESEGSPSMDNTFEVAEKTYDYLVNERGIQENKITILGHSLGGSVATNLASKKPNAKELVLVNTFSSISSVCFRQYSILCTFSGSLFNSTDYAKNVKIPVRFYAYKGDTTIPFEEDQKLFAGFTSLRSDQKSFTEIDGYGHSFPNFEKILSDSK